jgi:hypothetical protein
MMRMMGLGLFAAARCFILHSSARRILYIYNIYILYIEYSHEYSILMNVIYDDIAFKTQDNVWQNYGSHWEILWKYPRCKSGLEVTTLARNMRNERPSSFMRPPLGTFKPPQKAPQIPMMSLL